MPIEYDDQGRRRFVAPPPPPPPPPPPQGGGGGFNLLDIAATVFSFLVPTAAPAIQIGRQLLGQLSPDPQAQHQQQTQEALYAQTEHGAQVAEEQLGVTVDDLLRTLDYGFEGIDEILGSLGDFRNPALGRDILGQARGARGQLGNLANQAIGRYGNQRYTDLAANLLGGSDLVPQSIQEAEAYGRRARSASAENQALQLQQSQRALDLGLADRGISSDSGVAGGALADILTQGNQAQSQLNRELANQQAMQALQSGQFVAQHNLGRSDLFRQLQAMTNDVTRQMFDVGRSAVVDPIQLLQGIYQQNYMQPYLTSLGYLDPGGLLGTGFEGMRDANLIRHGLSGDTGEGYGASRGTPAGGGGGGGGGGFDVNETIRTLGDLFRLPTPTPTSTPTPGTTYRQPIPYRPPTRVKSPPGQESYFR